MCNFANSILQIEKIAVSLHVKMVWKNKMYTITPYKLFHAIIDSKTY